MDDPLFEPADLNIDATVARQDVAWFTARYGALGDAYRLLACYAAMPLVLTPELLNYLHNRFLADAGLPWVAEVDLLLSELVRPVGEELYAMPPATRAYLLGELRRRVGDGELASVARVLIHYTRHLARTNPALDDEELRAQQWAAMVYLDETRATAVRQVAEAFRAVADQLNAQPAAAPFDVQRAEFARLAHITQLLAPQIQAHPELVEYAKLVSRLLAGEAVDAAPASVQVADMTLPVPDVLRRRPPAETETAASDIHIRVARAPDGLYTVEVVAAGERTTASRTLDISPLMEQAARLLLSTPDRRSVTEAEALGRQLYGFLFPVDADDLIVPALPGTGRSTRLLLEIEPSELAALPWEMVHDGQRFLGQADDIVLMRYLPPSQPAPPLAPQPPLRILAVAAAPVDIGGLDQLDQDVEREKLTQAVAPLVQGGMVELTWQEHVTLPALPAVLRKLAPHVFYFSGHGDFDPHSRTARLLFETEGGRAQLVGGDDLTLLLAEHRSLRLAILNTNMSARVDAGAPALASTLVNAGLSAAIGLQGVITDAGAIRFAQRLFAELVRGRTVAEAVQAGRREMAQAAPGWLEWTLPVLFTATPDMVLVPPIDIDLPPSRPPISFDWVEIPAGSFLMGSDRKKDGRAYDNELPQHTVTLPAYRIARTPVTNAQYRVFVQATGRHAPQHWKEGRIPEGKEDHPVVYVSWQDAVAFCRWASEATGATIRLPTEAEWEKAARGTDGRIYPWGNDKPTAEHCNFSRNVGDTTPVGSYPKGASPYGVLDVAGNVWEWTNSLFRRYPYDPTDGREDSYSEERRTVRGGSFHDLVRYVRCACRYVDINPLYYVGWRVASPGSEDSAL
jgi:serine/threonine-protein kinase